jgi:hypothetical protein
MRSRSLVCAALVGFVLGAGLFSSTASAADPKGKAAKKKSDDLADDKVIGKQLQWEDSVMGADDKRGELDKIARAQAINKAASEKAEKDKAAREAREAKEKAAAEKAGPQTSKRGGEVALPTLSDEGPSKGSSKSGSTEISPKLDTAAAAAPPPVLKPADDKFIDKLLKEEGAGKKKKTVASDDKALIDILSTEKPGKAGAGAPKAKRKDDVDSLLSDADKQPFMGETKVKHETPEWAKPEIRSTPTPAPMVPIKQAKKDDGVIRVVQGAAGTPSSGGARPASATVSSRPAPTPVAPPPAPGRKSAAINSRPGEWADPFAEAGSRKEAPRKQVAAARTRGELDEDVRPARKAPAAAPNKREASRGSGDWNDPFQDSDKTSNSKRGAAPAGKARGGKSADPASWKDPFTSSEPAKPSRPVAGASAKSAHGPVAMRATAPTAKTAPKVAVARRPAIATVAAADEAPKAQGRWGILKKRH